MYKKKEEEVKAGAPEWLGTYGDMVTLVLTFFILLYAMSSVDSSKLAQLVASYSGNELDLTSSGGADGISDLLGNGIMELPTSRRAPQSPVRSEESIKAEAEMIQMASDFKTYFAENNLAERIEVTVSEDSLTMNFKDDMLFDSGSADIRDDAYVALDIIAEVLTEYPDSLINIEGHTDSIPISTAQFPSNWYLSTTRAIRVGEYFIYSKGMPPSHILATGRGEFIPVASNDTLEGRAKNRRVEISIVSGYLNGLDE